MSFSSLKRKQYLEEMEQQIFDLLVIGGGITGVGIALEAQSRGLKTALIEMQDFAAGTSSRSTKLIHGGLRYLKQLEVRMVAEVGKERAIVYENGPHVTTPEWMLLPIYSHGSLGRWTTSLGLRFYDYLAGVKPSERRRILSREETMNQEPLLRNDQLKGSGYYVEYRTDDARLTIEVLKKAVGYGTLAVNYVKVKKLIYTEEMVVGVYAEDQLDQKEYSLRAKKIVNATGPWVDHIRELDQSKRGKTLHLTKGVHLVFDQSRFPLKQAIYFEIPDRRMVFAIPRDGKTYVGTTDTDFHDDLICPQLTKKDCEYLFSAIHFIFPDVQLTMDDLESSWVGVRPLIHEEGKGPSEISRKDEIFQSHSGLISIAGGKLTGYRKMAESTVDVVIKQLRVEGFDQFSESQSKNIPVSGGDVGGSAHFPFYIKEKLNEAVKLGLTKTVVERLVKRYGSNIDILYRLIEECREEAVKRQVPVDQLATLIYSLQYEMTTKPVDFFIRRTGALYFQIHWVRENMEWVIHYMADQLQWTIEETNLYKQELVKQLHEAITPIE